MVEFAEGLLIAGLTVEVCSITSCGEVWASLVLMVLSLTCVGAQSSWIGLVD